MLAPLLLCAPATLVSLLVVTKHARPACWDTSHPSPTHLSQPTPSPLSGLDLPNYPISNCPPHLDPGTLRSIYHLLPYYISDLLIFLSLCLSQLGNELYNGRAFCLVFDREDCFLRFPDSPPPIFPLILYRWLPLLCVFPGFSPSHSSPEPLRILHKFTHNRKHQ